MIDVSKVKSLGEWPDRRKEIATAVGGVLGKLPKNRVDPQAKIIDEQDGPGYVQRRVNYFVDEWSRVTAWIFVPEGKDVTPGIVCCHRMTPCGKNEPAGIEGTPLQAFARHYAERGYATIAPDSITAGERVSPGYEPFDTTQFYKDHSNLSAAGKMLADHMRAIDILLDVRGVDATRIGVIGHDMGGYNALLLTAFDERIQACVASGAFTMFSEDEEPERWSNGNGFAPFPKLDEAVKSGRYPFDWDQVLAMIAPTPTLLVTALNDEVLSNTKSCEKAVKRARNVYKLLGAEKALENFTHREGHGMTPEALDVADEWFERWL